MIKELSSKRWDSTMCFKSHLIKLFYTDVGGCVQEMYIVKHWLVLLIWNCWQLKFYMFIIMWALRSSSSLRQCITGIIVNSPIFSAEVQPIKKDLSNYNLKWLSSWFSHSLRLSFMQSNIHLSKCWQIDIIIIHDMEVLAVVRVL